MSDKRIQNAILIIEDEEDLACVLEFNLKRGGYDVSRAEDLASARKALVEREFSLVVLDLRLPDGSGLDLLRESPGPMPPTIIVSALGDEPTVVEGLNLGAEDYVTKPYRLAELMARIEGILRRHPAVAKREPAVSESFLECAGISLDFDTFEAKASGDVVNLTRSEFYLVAYFLRNPNRVLTRNQLCDKALDAAGSVQERVIDAHIRTIRRKLGSAGSAITTVWGVGYKFVPDGSE